MVGGVSSGINGSSGRNGRRRRSSYAPMSEINVTPFVDVMLVLLIVFMVAAPMLTVGVPLELPRTEARPLQGDTEPITVSVDSQGRVFIQESEVELDALVPTLVAITEQGYDERIFVRGDQTIDYGMVMRVMGRLNSAGFSRIGLVTAQEEG